jgi:hypothetical protein
MPFDEALAARARAALADVDGLIEKRMFGGIAFLLNGNMCCGVHGEELILRLAPERAEEALAEAHTRIFDLTGRPMKGWLLVAAEGIASEQALRSWIGEAAAYARSLPAK